MIGPKFHRLAQLFMKYKKYHFCVKLLCQESMDTKVKIATPKDNKTGNYNSVAREPSVWEGKRMGCQRVSRLDKGEGGAGWGWGWGMVSKPE